MISLIAFGLGLFLAYKMYSNRNTYKMILWFLVPYLLINGYVTVVTIPITFPIARWLIFSLILALFTRFSYVTFSWERFPLKKTMIFLILSSFAVALLDNRLSLFYKVYHPFCEVTDTYFAIFIGFMSFNKKTNLSKIIGPLLIATVFISGYGLLNYITKTNPYYLFVLDSFFKGGDADLQSRMSGLVGSGGRFRVNSTFNSSFVYGFVSSILTLVFLYFNVKGGQKILYLGFFCGLVGVILCGSRTVFVVTVLAVLMFLLLSYRFSRMMLTILIIFLIGNVLYYVSDIVQESVDNSIGVISGTTEVKGSSVDMRETQFLGSLKYFVQSPILGNGYGYIKNELGWGDRDNAVLDEDLYGFESIIYQLMIEQGLVGLISKTALFVSLFVYFLKARRVPVTKLVSNLGLSISFCFLAFAVATGPLGCWPLPMFLVGLLIRKIEIDKRRWYKRNRLEKENDKEIKECNDTLNIS